MNETNTLQMTFKDPGGDNFMMSLPYANGNVQDTDVKTLMDTIVTQKALWSRQPAEKVKAVMVTKTLTEYDIFDQPEP